MKVLLDTNIIIHREASRVVLEDIGQVFQWLDKLNYAKYVHPITVAEIDRLRDDVTRKTLQIKLSSYTTLIPLKEMSTEVENVCRSLDQTQNDQNDTLLVNEVVGGRVDLLITEDKQIKRKAELLNVGDRVLKISEFLESVTKKNPEFADYRVLSVRRTHFADIDCENDFFQSFRQDYPDFTGWFNRKSQETAYISQKGDEVLGFLYLKLEGENEPYPEFVPAFPRKKRLKIGTFKARFSRTLLGERFLKVAFDNAVRHQVEEIYVTVFEGDLEKEFLINLLKEFGFVRYGIKKHASRDEAIYVRNMRKTFEPERPKETYPYFSKRARSFMVPIYPEYHTKLFPDSILKTESPNEYVGNDAFLNSISKVYVSRSRFKDLKAGDLIVFYRTGGLYKSVISTIGIVENVVINIPSDKEFARLCRKRSVLTDAELTAFWNHFPNLRPFIVNFVYAYSFPKRINLARLIELGVIAEVESAPRGFELLTQENLETILKETETYEGIVVD